ncbi:RluA family pseudouridine synthase [Longibaculum muris]|uniref:Pseudouridine synthase n=1 Tax=Longibaculum muris TaxID=1796628 RepID=A0A4R3Z4S4_9FIRM|nr:RluA family pseudouridine synthase [Longibaculum muris]MCR1887886.1 RluA family pseudouridine synthase [Longibaculum muris]TCW01209.1 23S rRNA pseudouridine1911/1915/1917 synthase [Longibaculum muris]
MEDIKITVVEEAGQRIDKILVKALTDFSRTQIQMLIQDGHVLVNGKAIKASYKVEVNDEVMVHIPEPESTDILAEDIPLDIVYEDQDVIVVNKPTGMIVHPSAGIYKGTLVNALLYHCHDLSGINGVMRPGIVHRIDKETSGLLMVVKNDMAHASLSEQLQEHTVTRRYLALVHGLIPHEFGRIEAPIGRDPKDRQKMTCTDKNAKDAITNFKVLERFKDMTLVECRLETGRTHQIRVHMQYIGHPVYGDPQYGLKRDDTTYGQYLHAKILGFVHPRTGEDMYFESELPDFFKAKLDELRNEMN